MNEKGYVYVYTCIRMHACVADEAWYLLKHVLCSGWLCITSRTTHYLFREMWFMNWSYMCVCVCVGVVCDFVHV